MTIHNAMRRYGDLARAAKIAFGLDAGDSGLERLSESVVVNRAIWEEPENAILRGEKLCVGYGFSAGLAANYAHASLSMMDPGMLLVIERIEVTLPAPGYFFIGRNNANLGDAAATYGFRDNRAGTVTAPQGRVYTERNGIAIGVDTYIGSTLGNVTKVVEYPAVLASIGTLWRACIVRSATLNTDMYVSFFWRERSLLPGELNR